jgi:hypothetical protein
MRNNVLYITVMCCVYYLKCNCMSLNVRAAFGPLYTSLLERLLLLVTFAIGISVENLTEKFDTCPVKLQF